MRLSHDSTTTHPFTIECPIEFDSFHSIGSYFDILQRRMTVAPIWRSKNACFSPDRPGHSTRRNKTGPEGFRDCEIGARQTANSNDLVFSEFRLDVVFARDGCANEYSRSHESRRVACRLKQTMMMSSFGKRVYIYFRMKLPGALQWHNRTFVKSSAAMDIDNDRRW